VQPRNCLRHAYLTRNRFTFALETDEKWARRPRRARIPDQPLVDGDGRIVFAGHHPQPARTAHLRATDQSLLAHAQETMIRGLRILVFAAALVRWGLPESPRRTRCTGR
jgi:hypothetical protein